MFNSLIRQKETKTLRHLFQFPQITALILTMFITWVGLANAAFEDQFVGYYSFDGHYNDTSGSNHVNNASAVGTPNVNAAGLFAKAVSVSGGTNYVTLGQPADYLFGSSTSFTFTYWLKVPSAITSDPTLIGNKDWSVSGGRQGFVQAIAGDDVKTNISDGSTRKDTGLVDLDPTQWVFCALVIDRSSNTMTNYVLDENVVNQWDDASMPTTVNISGVGSLNSGFPVNIGQDGDGGGYTQLSATFDDMGIWRRALAEYEIWAVYQAGRQGHPLPWVVQNPPTEPPEPLAVEVGPYVQFTAPDRAVVRWDTTQSTNSIVEYGLTAATLTSRVTDGTAKTTHEIILNNLDVKDTYFYRVGSSDGAQEQFSKICLFDNSINYSRADVSNAASPYMTDSLTPLYQQAADRIVSQYGLTKGICLVYGCGEGRLAFELAKRTDMMIVGVDTDAVKVKTAISKLMQAGVYGARVTVQQVSSLDSLPFTNYMANLIVSDNIISAGQCSGSAAEMFRVLRPSGGVAYLGQPDGCPTALTKTALENWLNSGSLTFTTTDNTSGLWSKVVRPDLPGAGWWSHMYGDASNMGNSMDTLEGGTRTSDFDIQWISWPGADSKVDRSPRGHGPVTKNGRMVFYGLDRIITLDTYNGTILWSLEIPDLKRFNMPRDAGWICLDDDYVYIAVEDDCWTINADTGLRTVTHKLNDPGYDWGCVFRYNDKLYGSAVVENTFYTGWWSSTYWYEGFNEKVCSKYLFANNLDGSRAWTYHSQDSDKGVIINSAICMGGGNVYFVESRNPAAKSLTTSQIGSQLWSNLYMVALNAETGVKLWEKDLKSTAGGNVVDGTVTFFLMYSDGKLVISLADGGTTYHLYAYDVNASSCTLDWHQSFAMKQSGHGGNKKRAVVMGGNVYLERRGYRLSDGAVMTTAVPWANCGTYSGNAQTMFYRGGNIAMWDKNSGSSTTWNRIRPNCWLNVIGSGGMVLAPEGGGGCDCYDGGFHTSVAFIRSQD